MAALLVRLGGYGAGVFEGERLVASKVGTRFVKNRHKKGGSSANRFRRRREEQTRVLVEAAAEVAARVLDPWRERVEFVALGGDRAAVEAVLASRAELAWLRDRALARFFTVPEPRQRVLEAFRTTSTRSSRGRVTMGRWRHSPARIRRSSARPGRTSLRVATRTRRRWRRGIRAAAKRERDAGAPTPPKSTAPSGAR